MTTTTKEHQHTPPERQQRPLGAPCNENVGPDLIAFLEELGDDAEAALAEAGKAADAELEGRMARCRAAHMR